MAKSRLGPSSPVGGRLRVAIGDRSAVFGHALGRHLAEAQFSSVYTEVGR